MASRIEDYALIGDCETAALVGRDGSIDWLCFPRFDSPACFAALLGTPDQGRWLIAPADKIRAVRRRYREGTLILETEYETEDGAVTLIDCMPPRTKNPDIVRMAVGKRGQVRMRVELIVRMDYGSLVPWVRRIDRGLLAVGGPDALLLRTPVELRGENFRHVGEFTVSEGERVPFTLTWFPSHLPQPPDEDPGEEIRATERRWQEWSGRCRYEGEWHDAVLRSLITLKALTYSPTGGLVAAPTTSLPERLGGVRNWDYRYCWLRDSTFALYALMIGGYVEEARAWREWLLRAIARKPDQVSILYGVVGERRLPELELPWLPGYEGSAPVRIGNAACNQFQLDVYGEVMDSLHFACRVGLEPDENTWRVQTALTAFVESAWTLPDEGLWEVRGPRRHFTHSKVMAWVALNRWRKVRDQIHAEVCQKGFDPAINSFIQYYGSKEVDGNLLLIPLVGFLPATDARMIGTVKAIEERLMADGFVSRYAEAPHVDGLPPGEGAFIACTFWLADNLALQGRVAEAREIFERLLSIRNDVGLLSEQYDRARHRLVGNFPQASSHVGLINTAQNLSRHGGPAENRR